MPIPPNTEAYSKAHSSDHTPCTTLRTGRWSRLQSSQRRLHPSHQLTPRPQPLHLLVSKLGRQKPTAGGKCGAPGPPSFRKVLVQTPLGGYGERERETRTQLSYICFVPGSGTSCLRLTYLIKEVARHKAGWVAGATYQRGLRLGVLPCSRGGWVVHEQIEGGVDGVFVHAAGALRGLQAWKNHSWSDAPARAAGAEGGLLAPEKNPKCQGGPLQGRDLRGWGYPQCQALAKYCDSDLLDSTPHPALRPRNLGQRFLL